MWHHKATKINWCSICQLGVFCCWRPQCSRFKSCLNNKILKKILKSITFMLLFPETQRNPIYKSPPVPYYSTRCKQFNLACKITTLLVYNYHGYMIKFKIKRIKILNNKTFIFTHGMREFLFLIKFSGLIKFSENKSAKFQLFLLCDGRKHKAMNLCKYIVCCHLTNKQNLWCIETHSNAPWIWHILRKVDPWFL